MTIQELEAEISKLDELVHPARRTMQSGREKKLDEFMQVVQNQTVSDANEKILVFSEHKDTVDYITRSLRERGYSVCNIHGGMKLQDRIEAEKEFKGPTQFMVATDAAGEGINLQFCRVMMNWDLPWNPNRLEQRMGRIHRYGQQSDVQIFNLVAETTREGMVLVRLMDKLKNMKDMLGHDQVYDVISGVLDGGNVRLDALIRDAILNRRSIDEILGEFDFVESESARAAAREALAEGLATSHIDLAFLVGEERESKERRLTPEFVEGFFVDALTYLGGKIEPGKDQNWRLDPLPQNLRQAVRAFNIGDLGKQRQLITFYKERVKRDPPVEFLAPDHPIFDAVADEILATGRLALTQGTCWSTKTPMRATLSGCWRSPPRTGTTRRSIGDSWPCVSAGTSSIDSRLARRSTCIPLNPSQRIVLCAG